MRRAFVDTQAWFSLISRHAADHAETAAAIKEYSDGLVTTTFVFAELISLLGRRLSHRQAAEAGDRLRNSRQVSMVHPDERTLARAWQLFLERPDKRYSLVDCLSFVVMNELGIDTAITGDHNFRQEGFITLPHRE